MEFHSISNGVEILYNDKPVFKVQTGDYLCTLGKGSNDYSMWHGSFKIKEKIDFKKKIAVKSVTVENDRLIITSDEIEFIITAENASRIKIEPVTSDDFNRMWISLPATREETVYGCGENFTEFNLRGKKVNAWVAEHINGLQTAKKIIKQVFGIKNTTKKQKFSSYETYYAEPTFLSSEKYYFHSESTARSEFDFTNDDCHVIKTDSIAPFYIGFDDDFESVISDLTLLLGRQPELPEWVYDGAILGIQGGTDIMMKKVDDCLKCGTDVCGVWIQDWEGRRVTAVGKQLQWNWQWDKELYPELDLKIKELNSKGIKVLGYINPFLAVEKPLYKEAHEKGYCVKDKDGNDYYVKITTFPAAMLDFTNPDACDWIKNIIKKNMIEFGFSGWMADFGEYLPTDCVLYSGEDPELVHNTWPARWAKLNREAVEECGKLGEIMFFTRAGYTDTKKYSTMMWNGDNHVDYSIDFGLPSVIPAALSLTCCGYGLSHSDIGGYTTFLNLKRSEELFMRWCEMNVFTPLLRGHEGLNPDANAQFDHSEATLKHHAKMSRIHSALKPYIKECVKYNAESGVGVIRPLFFYYNESKAYNEVYEYLLGRDILVAPILKANAKSREVYLPDDEWVHLWSEKEYVGGVYTVSAPVGEIPIFIRKNAKDFNSLIALNKIK
ncbi:MAG: alpha-glucosidase [Faecalibacterium sp.]|nr:alpha-glucosidase [Ruminococcus sp.]MCM1391841.1 alpha-glucosidase [Ruminococcus sp.]MCM1485705.1 alpha-glucosidase [Faecalibacterium sp.]